MVTSLPASLAVDLPACFSAVRMMRHHVAFWYVWDVQWHCSESVQVASFTPCYTGHQGANMSKMCPS